MHYNWTDSGCFCTYMVFISHNLAREKYRVLRIPEDSLQICQCDKYLIIVLFLTLCTLACFLITISDLAVSVFKSAIPQRRTDESPSLWIVLELHFNPAVVFLYTVLFVFHLLLQSKDHTTLFCLQLCLPVLNEKSDNENLKRAFVVLHCVVVFESPPPSSHLKPSILGSTKIKT